MNEYMKTNLSAFILAIGIAVSGLAIGFGLYSLKTFEYVSVKGLAEKVVKSNDAVWQIRFSAAGDDLNSVYQQITQSQNKVKDFLKHQGFQDSEMELMTVDITDNQAQSYNNKVGKRYSSNGGVMLHTGSVDQVIAAQQKVSQLVQQGVVLTQSQANYYFTKLNDIKLEMLNEATKNAQNSAEAFAVRAHNDLGKIHNASQGLFTITDVSPQTYGPNVSVMKNVRVVTTVEYFLK